MKRKILTTLFFLFGFFAALVFAVNPTEAEIGKSAPNFTLPDSNGISHSLSDYEECTTISVRYNITQALNPNSPDSDGDGFKDILELELFMDPLNKWVYPKPDLDIVDYVITPENLTIIIQNK